MLYIILSCYTGVQLYRYNTCIYFFLYHMRVKVFINLLLQQLIYFLQIWLAQVLPILPCSPIKTKKPPAPSFNSSIDMSCCSNPCGASSQGANKKSLWQRVLAISRFKSPEQIHLMVPFRELRRCLMKEVQ